MRFLTCILLIPSLSLAGSVPVRAKHGMVVSQNLTAASVGAQILEEGGSAVDAAIATAFALAVTFPAAGNIGGGGFLLLRPSTGSPVAYDFRETAPTRSSPTMFLKNGAYDENLHHEGYLSIGVPGSVAGLHLAWKENGHLPWHKLLEPAIRLAREGFPTSDGLAHSLRKVLPEMSQSPAAFRQFSKNGTPFEVGEILRQPDLAGTLERIAEQGPEGFYEGPTAALIAKEMRAHGGLITEADLHRYHAVRRMPLRGSYRGYEVLSMPPPSSAGSALLEMLNTLEGYDLRSRGFGAASEVHVVVEAMRRAFADRARYLGDPDFNASMPIERLISKEYAAKLRDTIDSTRASESSPSHFDFRRESAETTHISVVDSQRNAVALTTTLEDWFGAKIVVPGAGFLLNNEMGDFNAGPGLTDKDGLIGTEPNLSAPGKRMLSSMAPTILAKDRRLFLVLGTPGGRTIPNSVLLTILNIVDFGMNVQEAVDAPRFHHQWLPDAVEYEKMGLSPDTLALLQGEGYRFNAVSDLGSVEAILVNSKEDLLEGASDRRRPDGGAVGK